MGQKVNPHGLRVGVIKDWDSRWFANDSQFGDILVEDYNLRKTLKKQLYAAGVPKIEIERDASKVRIHIHCAKPGMVIGKGGAEIEKLRQQCEKMLGKPVVINIVEVRQPDLNAQLVAENIASQLERRISFRRAMKGCIGRSMSWAPRASRPRFPAVWAAPRSPAAKSTMTAPSRCRPSAPTSTMALPRPTPPTAALA